jgi:hypothetical protein
MFRDTSLNTRCHRYPSSGYADETFRQMYRRIFIMRSLFVIFTINKIAKFRKAIQQYQLPSTTFWVMPIPAWWLIAYKKRLCPQITAHQSDLSNLLQSVADKWNDTATTLQAYTPEVRKTAQELQTSFNSGLQLFFEEAQKVGHDLLKCRVVVNSKLSPVDANIQNHVG